MIELCEILKIIEIDNKLAEILQYNNAAGVAFFCAGASAFLPTRCMIFVQDWRDPAVVAEGGLGAENLSPGGKFDEATRRRITPINRV